MFTLQQAAEVLRLAQEYYSRGVIIGVSVGEREANDALDPKMEAAVAARRELRTYLDALTETAS